MYSSQADCEYFLKLTTPQFVICHVKFYSMLRECYKNLMMNATFFTVGGQAGDSVPIERLFEQQDNESHFE